MKLHNPTPYLHSVPQRQNYAYVASILLQVAIFDSLLMVSGQVNEDGSFGRQLLWGLIGAVTLTMLVLARFADERPHMSVGGWPLAAFLIYAFSSAMWSTYPETTLKRATLLFFLIALCAVSVGTYKDKWRDDIFSKLLGVPLLCLTVAALLISLVLPERAFTELGWRGISSQKNEAGQMTAITVLLLLYGFRQSGFRMKLRLALLALTCALLLLTKSTTSLLALIIALLVVQLVVIPETLRKAGSWRVAIFSATLFLFALAYFLWILELVPPLQEIYQRILNSAGKNATFTGRTAIWNLVLGESRFHNPYFGGGYGGFWVGRNSISSYVIVGADLYPRQAHNGYIDIYNDLGIVGLAILSLTTFFAIGSTLRLLKIGHAEGRLHLGIYIFCIILNLGESTFLRNTQFMNIVFIASLIRCRSILASSSAETAKSGTYLQR